MANLVPVDFDPFASGGNTQQVDPYAKSISNIESGGRYDIIGPATRDGDRAIGKYQVMGKNVGPWTKEALGQELTPEQFVSSPDAQEAVFKHKFGSYVSKYGPEGAARAWFAGEGGMNDMGRKDVLGTSVADYASKFNRGMQANGGVAVSAQSRGPQLVPVDHDPFAAQPQGQPQQAEPKDPRASTKLYVGPDSFNDRFTGEPAAPKRDPGYVESAGRGALQGASFGFDDELRGASAAALAGLPEPIKQVINTLPGNLPAKTVAGIARLLYESYQGEPGDATKAYDLTVANERKDLANAREQYPVTTTLGEVGGAIAMPVGGLLGGATLPVRMGRGAGVGAVSGALYGAGQGEDMESRARGAAVGGGVGGLVGGAGAAILGPRVAGPAMQAGPDVIGAAERLGVQLPKAVASDSGAVQQIGKVVTNVPLVGQPLRKASQRAIDQIGQAADNVQRGLGSGSATSAGQAAREGIETYIGKTTADRASALYNKVDDLVNPTVTTPLNATRAAVGTIAGRRTLAAMGDSPAASQVAEALSRTEGLTYEGIKQLRTSIGEMMKGGILPANISQAELKQLYGALTKDLRSSVDAAGGSRAAAMFDRANKYYELVSARRESLMRIVGAKSDEGVVERIAAAASAGSRADMALLSQARKALPPDEWGEVASAIVARLGRDVEGNFSADRFLTGWGKLSGQGKAVLFSGDVRKSLDDIATVSSRFKQLQQYANPSGTGQQIMGGALGAGAILNPITALKVVLPAAVLSHVLSRPATSKAASTFSKAVEAAVKLPVRAAKNVISREADRLSVVISKDLGVPQLASDLSRNIQGAVYSRAKEEDSKP